MPSILNQTNSGPGGNDLNSFKNGRTIKTLIAANTPLYRIVTNENSKLGLLGNNFIEGAYWFDNMTFNEIARKVNYEKTNASLTNLSRSGLAVTPQFNALADRLIAIVLKQDVYGWKGEAAEQEYNIGNGKKVKLPGGLIQIWIPNLTAEVAAFKFYHSI
jgi:hypothetical protein